MMISPENKKLWFKWVLYCAFGELIGIGIAGGIAFGVNTIIGEPQNLPAKLWVLFFMLIAGCVEGFLLGTFQWKALKDKWTSIPKKEWVFYTVLAAVMGWFLGMLPSLFFTSNNDLGSNEQSFNFDNPLIFAILSISTGLLLGAIFGLFQWFVLKKYVVKSYQWIIANSLGWGLGIGWIYLFASLPDENANVMTNIVFGIAGGLLGGLSVGGITGLFLLKIKER